jgi:hypothetical protein
MSQVAEQAQQTISTPDTARAMAAAFDLIADLIDIPVVDEIRLVIGGPEITLLAFVSTSAVAALDPIFDAEYRFHRAAGPSIIVLQVVRRDIVPQSAVPEGRRMFVRSGSAGSDESQAGSVVATPACGQVSS